MIASPVSPWRANSERYVISQDKVTISLGKKSHQKVIVIEKEMGFGNYMNQT